MDIRLPWRAVSIHTLDYLMDLTPLKNARRWEMGARAWRRAFALTLGFVSFVTLISVVLSISEQQIYVILSPLYESRVKEGEARTEEFVFQPMFNLSALNVVCNLDIPEEVFTTCRNKTYPILNKVTNETQMAISPRIHVLGERHSATNLAAHLAVGNFELVFNKTGKLPKLPGIDFGINRHKHNIQNNGPYEKGLSIISIKNPYDYTRSMLKECYNCGPQEKNRGNPAAFVGTEWHLGAHVWQYHFANLMVMRKEKYCNYLEKAAELTDCIMLVHSEDNLLPIHQEHYVWRIAKMTGWPLKEDTIRTKSDYSGHSAGGGFQLSKLVDGITYFKTDYSTHEENVIHAVNDYMIDDFETAFGYHRIQVPEKPPIKKAEPIKNAEPIKKSDPSKELEAPSSVKFEPLEKDTSSKDDTPSANAVAGNIKTVSNKALEDIDNLHEERGEENSEQKGEKKNSKPDLMMISEQVPGKQDEGDEDKNIYM